MVRALLDGRKTQTRRVVKDMPNRPSLDNWKYEPRHAEPYLDAYCAEQKTPANPRGMSDRWGWWTRDDRPGPLFRVPAAPGDRMWVRETWRISPDACEGWPPEAVPCKGWIDYRAGGAEEMSAPSFSHALDAFGRQVDVDWDCLPETWRPSIFMPRWASRLTLIVEDVRVQRLHEISEEDARAEGTSEPSLRELGGDLAQAAWSDRQVFSRLWNSLHGPDAWAANTWVCALTFRVERRNIDQEPVHG